MFTLAELDLHVLMSLHLNFLIFSSGIQGDDNLQSMLVGTVMRKIKSRSWKKQRYFKLQEDCTTIWYKSKKAGNTHSTCKTTRLTDCDGLIVKYCSIKCTTK